MTEAKHTAGPFQTFMALIEWTGGSGAAVQVITGANGVEICRMSSSASPDDAALLTAAPDMLDALRQWQTAEHLKDFDELRNAKMSRDAAIAKATGAT